MTAVARGGAIGIVGPMQAASGCPGPGRSGGGSEPFRRDVGASSPIIGKLVRIPGANRFEDPALPGVLEVSVTLRAVSAGTDLEIVQANIPDPIPLEMCHLGWQESLDQLARLVEPEIAG